MTTNPGTGIPALSDLQEYIENDTAATAYFHQHAIIRKCAICPLCSARMIYYPAVQRFYCSRTGCDGRRNLIDGAFLSSRCDRMGHILHAMHEWAMDMPPEQCKELCTKEKNMNQELRGHLRTAVISTLPLDSPVELSGRVFEVVHVNVARSVPLWSNYPKIAATNRVFGYRPPPPIIKRGSGRSLVVIIERDGKGMQAKVIDRTKYPILTSYLSTIIPRGSVIDTSTSTDYVGDWEPYNITHRTINISQSFSDPSTGVGIDQAISILEQIHRKLLNVTTTEEVKNVIAETTWRYRNRYDLWNVLLRTLEIPA